MGRIPLRIPPVRQLPELQLAAEEMEEDEGNRRPRELPTRSAKGWRGEGSKKGIRLGKEPNRSLQKRMEPPAKLRKRKRHFPPARPIQTPPLIHFCCKARWAKVLPAAVRAGTDLAESYPGRPAIKTAEAAGAAERPDNYSARAAA